MLIFPDGVSHWKHYTAVVCSVWLTLLLFPDVSSVTNMNSVFRGAANFGQSLSNWNVSAVVDMGYMFQFAASMQTQPLNWDVSNVQRMDYVSVSAFRAGFDATNLTNIALF